MGSRPLLRNTEEFQVKALLETWADALRRHDVAAILAHHEPDIASPAREPRYATCRQQRKRG